MDSAMQRIAHSNRPNCEIGNSVGIKHFAFHARRQIDVILCERLYDLVHHSDKRHLYILYRRHIVMLNISHAPNAFEINSKSLVFSFDSCFFDFDKHCYWMSLFSFQRYRKKCHTHAKPAFECWGEREINKMRWGNPKNWIHIFKNNS